MEEYNLLFANYEFNKKFQQMLNEQIMKKRFDI